MEIKDNEKEKEEIEMNTPDTNEQPDVEENEDVDISSLYDEEEIGSHLTENYISIPNNITIKAAMKSLVKQAADNDNISVIYVLNEKEEYLGAIDLQDLIIARDGMSLADLINKDYPFIYAHEKTENCIDTIKDYGEEAIPVVDRRKKMLGVLMASSIAQIVDEELGEDYAKLAGLTAEEDLNEPMKKSIIKRLPWLIILLLLGLVVSNVVNIFTPVISHLSIIVIFQSLVLDMAGNIGTQSLAVTIRVLMDDQITGKNKRHLISKEARVGFTNGLILGVLSFIAIGIFLMITGNTATQSFSISACVGFALLLSMFLSSVVGTIIPIIFKKIHIDPAVASGPLITTVNDLFAVCLYYGLAWIFLLGVLGM